MKKTLKSLVLLVIWLLAAGSCLVWGSDHLWVAGLSVTVISIMMLTISFFFPDTSPREKQRYTVGGVVILLVGLGLLYVGLFRQ